MKRKKTKPGPVSGTKHNEVKRSPFGERLFALRKAKGLTQKQLGQKVGLSARMIAYYENDTQGPPVTALEKIAIALKISTAHLLGKNGAKIIKDLEKDSAPPAIQRSIEKLKKLPKAEQKTIANMIDTLAKAHKLS